MEFLTNVFTNMIANIAFWLILGAVFSAWVQVGQRNFRAFFGLARRPELSTCLSNVWKASERSRPRGYLVALHEIRASESVSNLFRSTSFRLPDLVRGLVDAIFLGANRYRYSTSVSPAETDAPQDFEQLGSNLIVVGSSWKNSIRRLYLQERRPSMQLSVETLSVGDSTQAPPASLVEVIAGPEAGRLVDKDGLYVAIVEKVLDESRNAVVFFCLGQRGDVTWAATEYLVRNWRSLRKEFGDRPFALCLGFRDQSYTFDYREPERLFVV